MRYGHSAQAPTLAKMSQALRSLVLQQNSSSAGLQRQYLRTRRIYVSSRSPVQRCGRALFSSQASLGDVEGEHTFWMARAHKDLLMPQRDLTVGGRAELRLAGMSADAVASVLDKES